MARPPIKIDNTIVKSYLSDYSSYYDDALPSWVNDLIRGGKGQMNQTCTSQCSSSTLFRVLQSLDEISSITVGSFINRRRMAFGDEPVGSRMIEYYTKSARCASQALAHKILMISDNHKVESARRHKSVNDFIEKNLSEQTVEGDVAFTVTQLRETVDRKNKEIVELRGMVER